MGTIYIIIVLIFRVVQTLCNKKSSNAVSNTKMLLGFTTYQNLISALLALILILLGGNGFFLDWKTVVIALFSGITLFTSVFFSLYAMKTGTVSLASMFGTAGLIIPVFAGIFLFDQSVHSLQWLGVALFFVSAWFLIGSSKEIFGGFSLKTFLLLLGTLVSNGGTMLAQQMFTTYVPKGDVSIFSFLSFAMVTILGFIVTKLYREKMATEEKLSEQQKKTLIISGGGLAFSIFIINQLATLSTAIVPPVVLFTFINGGGTIISTLVAALIFQEHLTKKSILGVILGVLSLVIIKAF